MSDRSTTHGPRVDDELSRESLEEAGEIDSSFALPHDEVEARAELAAALRPAAFPADAISLRRVAEAERAPDWVFDLLGHVDPVTRYETVGELWRAAGGHMEAGSGRAPVAPTRVKDAYISEPQPENEATTPPHAAPEATPSSPAPAGEANRGPLGPALDMGFAVVTWPARTALAVAARAVDVVRRRWR